MRKSLGEHGQNHEIHHPVSFCLKKQKTTQSFCVVFVDVELTFLVPTDAVCLSLQSAPVSANARAACSRGGAGMGKGCCSIPLLARSRACAALGGAWGEPWPPSLLAPRKSFPRVSPAIFVSSGWYKGPDTDAKEIKDFLSIPKQSSPSYAPYHSQEGTRYNLCKKIY